MIGSLKGRVICIFDDFITLEVCGVGYNVYLLSSLIKTLKVGDELFCFIEHVIRENVSSLYGVICLDELKCLRKLVAVNGVSYKIGMSVIDKLGLEGFWSALSREDYMAFKGTGVGKKIFSRILNEIKLSCHVPIVNNEEFNQEAVSALVNLGYSNADAHSVVSEICKEGENLCTEDVIRYSLKKLSSSVL